MLTVVDEVNRSARRCRVNTHLGLTYLSFLEALCRLAASQGCPPGLPLTVLASDAAASAATGAPRKQPTSANKKRRGTAVSGIVGFDGKPGGAGPLVGSADEEVVAQAADGTRTLSPASRGSRGRRLRSPKQRGQTDADADTRLLFGIDDAYGPTAPADLPSRLELLLVHLGVVENFNIARCRRQAPAASGSADADPFAA